MSNRTVLVTGGAGFIGANFILYWMKKYPEDKIINLDALTYAGNTENLASVSKNQNYTFIHGSICDPATVAEAMQGVDLVVHFAAESHVDRSIKNPGIFLETNVLGTHVLLEEALKQSVEHFHHISTDEVFGTLSLDKSDKFNENTPYDPRSPYSASKASSDHLVRAYGETYQLPYTITNCSNNYGEYQFPEKLISLAITNILEGKKVPVYGDGQQIRDWLYVQDHCSAIDAVIQSGNKQATYLVGGLQKDITNLEVVNIILEEMDASQDQLEFVKDRPGHDVRYSVDWNIIHSELGWEPSVTFREGIKKTIEWYTSNQEWWKPLKHAQLEYFKQQYSSQTGE